MHIAWSVLISAKIISKYDGHDGQELLADRILRVLGCDNDIDEGKYDR